MPDHGLVKPVRETANEIRDRRFAQDSGRRIAERVNAQFRRQLAAHRAMIKAENDREAAGGPETSEAPIGPKDG